MHIERNDKDLKATTRKTQVTHFAQGMKYHLFCHFAPTPNFSARYKTRNKASRSTNFVSHSDHTIFTKT